MDSRETTKASQPQHDGFVDISQLRLRIDAIDDDLMELILRRIELSSLVMEMKPQAFLVDPNREQSIIARYYSKLSGTTTLAKTKRLVAGIIGASRIYPE